MPASRAIADVKWAQLGASRLSYKVNHPVLRLSISLNVALRLAEQSMVSQAIELQIAQAI